MTHPYLPLTDEERKQMQKVIGAELEDFFRVIPQAIRDKVHFEFPAHNEVEVTKIFSKWAEMNTPVSKLISFL
ncbi:MAG TPA: hypothetical protein DEB05_00950, partial [Firmicutes bacterium]|nr:hypothetical protein [Bacillota bacterium]